MPPSTSSRSTSKVRATPAVRNRLGRRISSRHASFMPGLRPRAAPWRPRGPPSRPGASSRSRPRPRARASRSTCRSPRSARRWRRTRRSTRHGRRTPSAGSRRRSPAPITISTCTSRFPRRNQLLAPTARSSVSEDVFCTVMIRKKKPVSRITTTNARPRMIPNDCSIEETPGREATAVSRSSASTPSTWSVIAAARAAGSTPVAGSTPTRFGSTAGRVRVRRDDEVLVGRVGDEQGRLDVELDVVGEPDDRHRARRRGRRSPGRRSP